MGFASLKSAQSRRQLTATKEEGRLHRCRQRESFGSQLRITFRVLGIPDTERGTNFRFMVPAWSLKSFPRPDVYKGVMSPQLQASIAGSTSSCNRPRQGSLGGLLLLAVSGTLD